MQVEKHGAARLEGSQVTVSAVHTEEAKTYCGRSPTIVLCKQLEMTIMGCMTVERLHSTCILQYVRADMHWNRCS